MNSDFARKGAIAIAVLALLVAAPLIFYACGGGANGGSAGSAEVNGLVITPGTGEVALRWDPSPGAKSYIIYWDAKPTAGDRSQKTGAINLKSGGTSLNNSIKVKRTFYQHKGLRLNWIYFYVVLPFPDENPDDIHTPHPEIPAGGCQTENGCYFLYPYLCGDYCTSLDTDNNNCGSCGAICPTGTLCSSGVCLPALENGCTEDRPILCQDHNYPEITWCSNGSMVSYCGPNCVDCTTASGGNTSAACVNGACQTCQPGESACYDGCFNTMTDSKNCGACGNSCAAGETCLNGSCAASSVCADASKPDLCDGGCTSLLADQANCGACGNVCRNGTICNVGSCVNPAPTAPTCSGGQTMCGSACVSLTSDFNNCGACGVSCSGKGKSCTSGACV